MSLEEEIEAAADAAAAAKAGAAQAKAKAAEKAAAAAAAKAAARASGRDEAHGTARRPCGKKQPACVGALGRTHARASACARQDPDRSPTAAGRPGSRSISAAAAGRR